MRAQLESSRGKGAQSHLERGDLAGTHSFVGEIAPIRIKKDGQQHFAIFRAQRGGKIADERRGPSVEPLIRHHGRMAEPDQRACSNNRFGKSLPGKSVPQRYIRGAQGSRGRAEARDQGIGGSGGFVVGGREWSEDPRQLWYGPNRCVLRRCANSPTAKPVIMQ